MRTAIVTAIVALLGAACYSTPNRYYARSDATLANGQPARVEVFDAQTTNGDFVRVQQDPRTGELVIIEPTELRGERVALVNRDTGQGTALVTIDTRQRRYHVGSGGDVRDRHDDGERH